MGMTIDESIKELEKARDSIEPCLFLDEAIDQSMKTAIEIMRKYQKIEQIIRNYDVTWESHHMKTTIDGIREVLEDGNDD